MIDFIRKIVKAKYQTLNTVEIIKSNLLQNVNYLYSLQEQAEIFPVLKSNAYGHGLKEVCQILNSSQVKMVAVDSFPEAQIVYKYFKGKVLLLNEVPLKVYKYIKKSRSEFVIYNLESLKYVSRFGKKAQVHLFLNTGMNREGISDLKIFLEQGIKYLNKVEVSGFCSHLSEADNENSDLNKEQEERFIEGLELLHSYKIFPKWVHLGNSAGSFILNNPVLTAFRPGLAFYGYVPFLENSKYYHLADNNLKPALRIYSTITAVQKIRTGDRVSYANSFQANSEFNSAMIPFGYFEGLNRKLSNQARFLIKQNKQFFWAKILGNVCMNMTCIDCRNIELSSLLKTKVQIVSELNDMENSVKNLARLSEIIPYEFLVKINNSIHRKIV